ncbi:hypothetical protein [Cecembia rubra]|uniref:Uncharacterized protein n=1 Tax=Cecembia rubra TaxID=1485585 RepID=A0A2P8EAC8_9BACT|nr:hypothetical protein [Cecembia rubra]PSL06431.1 hypothetical protein CLV48_102247 [Cecembia rubra]
MKKIKIFSLGIAMFMGLFITSCDLDPTEALRDIIKEDFGYLPVIANFTLASPTASATAPIAGTNCTFDLRYWSEGEIDKIQFWVRIGAGSPQLVDEKPYSPAFSNITKTDSLLFNYTIPTTVPTGTVVAMEARVTNKNVPDFPVSRTVNVTVR